MDTSPALGLAYLAPQQAQKHVTVNEALRRLDALVQLTVLSADLAIEPATPAEGDAYILPAGASGAAWSAFAENAVSVFQDGAWTAIAPAAGWRAYVRDQQSLVVFDEAGWTPVSGALAGAATFGVNTTADTTNRLAVKSDAALFAHDDVTPGTGDIRVVIDKDAEGDTGSVLFQTGASGRAEIGLTGSDDLEFKVSADGSAWTNAMTIDKDAGYVGLNGALPTGPLNVRSSGVSAGGDVILIEGQGNAERVTIHSVGAVVAPQFQGRGASGSLAAPGATAANSRLFGLGGSGHDGSSFVTQMAALIEINADDVWAGSSHPTRIAFRTTPSGATAAGGGTERMRITPTGDVGIGLTSPAAKLDVDGPVRVKSYAKSSLPSATAAGQMIYVSDEAGGPVIAFSDGTSWRRATDRAIVS